MTRRLALIGNPNCGKTTVFNLLTGANQKVGNWPGVTIERKSGHFSLDGQRIELDDLPGIYSLEQEHLAIDEAIAKRYLDIGEFDLLINLIDATQLERSLVLTQQLLERGRPLILVLNMVDVAAQHGVQVDAGALQAKLGVPVVTLVASRRQGLDNLRQQLSTLLRDLPLTPAHPEPPEPVQAASEDRVLRRYHQSRQLVQGVVEVSPTVHTLSERLDGFVLNRLLGIPVFLLMMYLVFTVAVNLGAVFIDFFDILFNAVLVDGTTWLLTQLHMPAVVITLLADGIGGGITLVATFIPVIGFLYLCLSALEDSGYMSRAAFVVDRLMGGIGLPGNAFVPLIVGFGCNVPAVMASRTLNRDSDRLLTVAMAPFMSCGARLTVYAVFAAAFFQRNGQNVVFLLYLLGISLAVFTGWVFRRQLFKGDPTPSFQEMPAYHIPVLRNILITTWFRLRGFIVRAGRTIVSVVVVLSLLNSIGTDFSFGNEDSENSVLSRIGKTLTPAFAPIGITPDNWPATVGLFTGMFAKEAIVGTLDALYSAGPDAGDGGDQAPDLLGAAQEAVASIGAGLVGLGDLLLDPLGVDIGDSSDAAAIAAEQGVEASTLTNMAALFGSSFAAFCYLVFVLLYAPCVAVLGAITKEAGRPWMLLVFSWCTGLAYICASVLYQIGTFLQHPVFSSIWIFAMISALFLFIHQLKKLTHRVVRTDLIPVVRL